MAIRNVWEQSRNCCCSGNVFAQYSMEMLLFPGHSLFLPGTFLLIPHF